MSNPANTGSTEPSGSVRPAAPAADASASHDARPWLARLLRPGQDLMRQLPIGAKLALVVGSLFLPLTAMMYSALAAHWQDRQDLRTAHQAGETLQLIVPVIVETQRHR